MLTPNEPREIKRSSLRIIATTIRFEPAHLLPSAQLRKRCITCSFAVQPETAQTASDVLLNHLLPLPVEMIQGI